MSSAAASGGARPRRQRRRVAILISGRGSNMNALIEAAANEDFPAEIVAVLADKASAPGLARAAAAGIAARAVPRSDHDSRTAHEEALTAALEEAGAELVCLAGYMRILSADFVARWRGRTINIHPSLLPAFPGLDTHHRALAAGCRIHGASVHFVTEEMDAGPIIAQAAVPVRNEDTPETLAARVLAAEHRLYPAALALVARGGLRMSGDGLSIPSGAGEVLRDDDTLIVTG